LPVKVASLRVTISAPFLQPLELVLGARAGTNAAQERRKEGKKERKKRRRSARTPAATASCAPSPSREARRVADSWLLEGAAPWPALPAAASLRLRRLRATRW
jgi:hypothetical protein